MSKPVLFALTYVLVGWLVTYGTLIFVWWLVSLIGGKIAEGMGDALGVWIFLLFGLVIGTVLNAHLGYNAGLTATWGAFDHSHIVVALLFMVGIPFASITYGLLICCSS